ncbi:MAG: DNA-3-methyladenine glycosylase, partial [Patescibacteria group bacterium]|nr:DNA-3-methyladenine glycosylase [Patescibacteria group bacterium]
MAEILNQKFFNRPTTKVAKELLGKFLVCRFPRESAPDLRKSASHEMAVMITETEAYDGPNDKASHASRGKTKRTEPMFGKAGNFYVYLIYGMYYLLNIVTGPKNYPAAVLIRGVKITGPRREIRANAKPPKLNGPGKITKYLGITNKINAKPADRKTGVWFEDRGIKIKPGQIVAGKRIGV